MVEEERMVLENTTLFAVQKQSMSVVDLMMLDRIKGKTLRNIKLQMLYCAKEEPQTGCSSCCSFSTCCSKPTPTLHEYNTPRTSWNPEEECNWKGETWVLIEHWRMEVQRDKAMGVY